MRYYVLSTIFLLFPLFFYAQCDCSQELDFVAAKLKKVPSFKSQIKNKKVHEAYIVALKKEIEKDDNIQLNCLGYLQKYLKTVRDQHLYIIKKEAPVNGDLEAFYQREGYKLTPVNTTPGIELIQSAKTDNDPITTVYRNISKNYKLVIVKDSPDVYHGIILESDNPYWKKGQVRLVLGKGTGEKFEQFEYNGYHQVRYAQAYFKNKVLYPSIWIPLEKEDAFKINPYKSKPYTFNFESVNESTNYLYLGSFDGSNSNKRKADSIYTIASKFIGGKPKLILDVTNNGGGGIRTYKPFIDLLSTYDKLTIYLIQNKFCASACEQFILKLKAKANVVILGENTRGTLAYGYGNGTDSYSTPCYGFKFQPTSKKFERYLKYETTGITPDVQLHNKTSWVSQVEAYLKENP